MNKTKIVIDFETKSNEDIENGRVKYVMDEAADILMMSYKIGDSETQLWVPEEGKAPPAFVHTPYLYDLYAHNAQFEHIVWNVLGNRYNFAPTKIDNWYDIMALCGRYGLPQSLEKAGEVLKLQDQKDKDGKALIKLFCTPVQNFGRDTNGKIRDMYLNQWNKFKAYCITDADSEYELLNTLPADHLSEDERWTWLHSCKVNQTGIPVDVEAAAQIMTVAEIFRQDQFDLLPDLTDGRITKITQVKRIKEFFNDKGIAVENCAAETISALLERDDLPEEVLLVAEMRASLGMSSIGKYKRIQDMQVNGRIFDNQRYYGAHTGRWTGGGFQLLNLPRASVDDPENEIQRFISGDIMEDNPVRSARALIRAMIKAPKGKLICAADYSSIEYVVEQWFAGDTHALKRFADGFDQYVDQAAYMYGIHEDAVVKDQRQKGKVVVLGCGYGLGANGLIRNAKEQWGMTLTFEEADYMVKSWRKKNAKIVSMWYKLKDAMILAIESPGKPYKTNYCRFQVVYDRVKTPWLALTLPSGRTMYYNRPFVDDDTYGPVPCHWGMHQETKTWRPLKLIPGRIAENIVQAASRDILVNGMKALDREGYSIIGSIYDEVISEVSAKAVDEMGYDAFLQRFCHFMCERADWSKDIPVRADGYIGPRYKKM